VEERLQKIMARSNLGSRRACEAIIEAGRVTVNGWVAKLGDKADPAVDAILVDGRPLPDLDEPAAPDGLIYIALNKPRGVISSLEDEMEAGRTTVRDLIPIDTSRHIYPVGRLDKPSEGLVLMTNDGDLAHRLTHPRYGHEKVYQVELEGWVGDRALDQWRRGVMLDGRITAPAPIEIIHRDRDSTLLRIVLREGRKRQIRRIAAALGHPVRRLLRERIGPLSIGDLEPGQWRFLSEEEISLLRRSVELRQPVARTALRDGRSKRAAANSK
jgi:pseudouridine synthase